MEGEAEQLTVAGDGPFWKDPILHCHLPPTSIDWAVWGLGEPVGMPILYRGVPSRNSVSGNPLWLEGPSDCASEGHEVSPPSLALSRLQQQPFVTEGPLQLPPPCPPD